MKIRVQSTAVEMYLMFELPAKHKTQNIQNVARKNKNKTKNRSNSNAKTFEGFNVIIFCSIALEKRMFFSKLSLSLHRFTS